MPSTIEITMTRRGFEVRASGRTTRFPTLDEAVGFAQQRLQHAYELRDLSARCE
jgi:hypothetical protein